MAESKPKPKTNRQSLLNGARKFVDVDTELRNLGELTISPLGKDRRCEYIGKEASVLNQSHDALERWILAFKRYSTGIERGMRDEISLPQRQQLRDLANEELDALAVDFDEPTMAGDLNEIFDLLEVKLAEMADVLSEPMLQSKLGIKLPQLPHSTGIDQSGDALKEDKPVKFSLYQSDRKFLFIGYMLEILYQYRDQGKALVADKRETLLDKLDSRVRSVQSVITEIHSFLVVDQFFDEELLDEVAAMLQSGRNLSDRYREILRGRGDQGVSSALQKNGYQLRTQFTLACANVCFRLFGHVSNDILQKMLLLKSTEYLSQWNTSKPSGSICDAERQHFDRVRIQALERACRYAKRGSWPTYPILLLYSENKKFGNSPALPPPAAQGVGLMSMSVHVEF
jgi:hypothetical protein